MRLNQLDRHQVKAVAVGNTIGTVRFSVPDPTGLTNWITDDEDGIIVQATSLDSDSTPCFKNHLSFLKIDVEGG